MSGELAPYLLNSQQRKFAIFFAICIYSITGTILSIRNVVIYVCWSCVMMYIYVCVCVCACVLACVRVCICVGAVL